MSENKEFDMVANQFHDYLSMILKIYQDLIPVLRSELEAIEKDNVDELNDCLKSQQALLLQTKDFETKTNKYQSKLGISAGTLSEMILKLPEGCRLPFYEVLGQFGQTSSEVKFYQEKCRSLLQSKLYLIDKVLSKMDVQKDNITYNKDASEVQGSLFAKSLEIKF